MPGTGAFMKSACIFMQILCKSHRPQISWREMCLPLPSSPRGGGRGPPLHGQERPGMGCTQVGWGNRVCRGEGCVQGGLDGKPGLGLCSLLPPPSSSSLPAPAWQGAEQGCLHITLPCLREETVIFSLTFTPKGHRQQHSPQGSQLPKKAPPAWQPSRSHRTPGTTAPTGHRRRPPHALLPAPAPLYVRCRQKGASLRPLGCAGPTAPEAGVAVEAQAAGAARGRFMEQ